MEEISYALCRNRGLEWKRSISKEDGEFAIKYGIESYFIWRNFWVSDYRNYLCSNNDDYDDKIKECDNDIRDFWKDFNKTLNRKIEELEEKDRKNEDILFYAEVRLMEQYCQGTIDAGWGDLIGGVRTCFDWQRKKEEEEEKRNQEEREKKLEAERLKAEARKE